MSVRKAVIVVVLVNLAFLLALGGLYWSLSVRAQAGDQAESPAAGGQTLSIVSNYLSYQGVVTDSAGNPLNGSHSLTFTLYSCIVLPNPSCSSLWSKAYTVTLVDGLFNVRLGSLDPSWFEPRLVVPGWHLEVGTKVDGGSELSPRVSLNNTVPWAFTSVYTENMPAPAYDSGWVDSPGGVLCGTYTFPHALGTHSDNLVVGLTCKRSDGYGVYDCQREGGVDAIWFDLTSADVVVDPCVKTNDPMDFRVRIWVTR